MKKARVNPIERFHRLGGKRRLLLVQAAIALTATSAGVAFLPFRRAIRLGAVLLRDAGTLEVKDCVWAVEAAARRLPWRTACIEQGLAVQLLLRGAGISAILHYGARHAALNRLEAHVWVTVSGDPIIGGEQAVGFAEIATYP